MTDKEKKQAIELVSEMGYIVSFTNEMGIFYTTDGHKRNMIEWDKVAAEMRKEENAMDDDTFKDSLISLIGNEEDGKPLISKIERIFNRLAQYENALQFYADSNKYYYARKDHPNTRLAEDNGETARHILLRDRYDRLVHQGDTIQFKESENQHVVLLNHHCLGFYEEDSFVPLHLCSMKYEIVKS